MAIDYSIILGIIYKELTFKKLYAGAEGRGGDIGNLYADHLQLQDFSHRSSPKKGLPGAAKYVVSAVFGRAGVRSACIGCHTGYRWVFHGHYSRHFADHAYFYADHQ